MFLIRLLDQFKTSNGKEENSTPVKSQAIVSAANDSEKKQSPRVKLSNDQQTSNVPYAKALYDFHMNPLEDEGCLKFIKGMVFQVTRRVDQNWAEGKLGENVGIFPLSFVHMNQAATALMQSYSTKWRLPATMPPNNDQTPSTSTSPQRQTQQLPILLPTTPAQKILTSPTNPSQVFPAGSLHLQDKTGIYIALHNYSPLKPDELELKKGSQYIVKETCQDGWFKGVCSDNLFKKGVFPGNYVMPLLHHQKMISMQKSASHQAQANKSNSNTQQMNITEGYTNLGLSSIPPELPQRNVTNRSIQSPLSQQQTKLSDNLTTAQSQKTDENVNKIKKETVTEMLMKRLGYRKSIDSSAYSLDNPVFEDSSTTANVASNPFQYNHMRSGSCPIDLGVTNNNAENLQFGSQRVKTRERTPLPM